MDEGDCTNNSDAVSTSVQINGAVSHLLHGSLEDSRPSLCIVSYCSVFHLASQVIMCFCMSG